MSNQKKWKFYREKNGKLVSDHAYYRCPMEWTPGKWYHVEGPVETCENGFHCSDTIPHAYNYVNSDLLARVEVKGDVDKQRDKSAHRSMKVVRVWRVTRKVHLTYYLYEANTVITVIEKDCMLSRLRPHETASITEALNLLGAELRGEDVEFPYHLKDAIRDIFYDYNGPVDRLARLIRRAMTYERPYEHAASTSVLTYPDWLAKHVDLLEDATDDFTRMD